MLTEQQIDILKTRLGEFKKADLVGKRDIIAERAEFLEKSWRREYGPFVRKPVEDVPAFSNTSNDPHEILEHPAMPLQRLQKAVEEIRL